MSNQQALEDWLILSPPHSVPSCFVLLVVISFDAFFHHCSTFFYLFMTASIFFFTVLSSVFVSVMIPTLWKQRRGLMLSVIWPLTVSVSTCLPTCCYYFNHLQTLYGFCWHLNSSQYTPYSYMFQCEMYQGGAVWHSIILAAACPGATGYLQASFSN